jgi:hypothetical protein
MRRAKLKLQLACWSVLIFCSQTTVAGQQPPKQPAQQAGQPSVVSRYINALQKRDFKTIIDLTASYQAEIAQIKAQNPQVLWPKLISEYYDKKVSQLSGPVSWRSDDGTLGTSYGGLAQTSDPTAQTFDPTAIRAWFPTSSKWRVTETRDTVIQNVFGGQNSVTITYVEVDYPIWQDAPVVQIITQAQGMFSNIDLGMLEKTIIQFTFNSGSQLIANITEVAAGRVNRRDPLRILRAHLQENKTFGPSLSLGLAFAVVGGTSPFTCNIEFGQLKEQRDCYCSAPL